MADSPSKPGRIFRTGPDGQTVVDEETSSEAGSVSDATSGRSPTHDTSGNDARSLQEMTFSTHILSLNAMALMHLGELPGMPDSERDPDAARHLIDTLLILQEKTRGNLSPEEEKLISTLVYDLRMKFLRGAQ